MKTQKEEFLSSKANGVQQVTLPLIHNPVCSHLKDFSTQSSENFYLQILAMKERVRVSEEPHTQLKSLSSP